MTSPSDHSHWRPSIQESSTVLQTPTIKRNSMKCRMVCKVGSPFLSCFTSESPVLLTNESLTVLKNGILHYSCTIVQRGLKHEGHAPPLLSSNMKVTHLLYSPQTWRSHTSSTLLKHEGHAPPLLSSNMKVTHLLYSPQTWRSRTHTPHQTSLPCPTTHSPFKSVPKAVSHCLAALTFLFKPYTLSSHTHPVT